MTRFLQVWAAVLVLAAVTLVCTDTARADFQGTPGKIAYVDASGGTSSQFPLKIWDPKDLSGQVETTLVPSTYRFDSSGTFVSGEASAPSFSPDGTKIAFSKLIYDTTVVGTKLYHTSIFTMNVDGSDQQQLTTPDHFRPPSCGTCHDGHDVADYAAAWSPDGTQIAFIRQVAAGETDPLAGEGVQNIWTVPASGGGASQLTHGADKQVFQSVVWGQFGMITDYVDQSGGHLGTLSSSGGTPTPVVNNSGIGDYDVSPDGKDVTYSALNTVHVVGFDGSGDTALPPASQGSTVLDRYSPTGNGPLRTDCGSFKGPTGDSRTRCGIFEEHTDDPNGDIRSDDPPDRLMFDWTKFGGVVGGFNSGRAMWDVQAQQVPVIFAPGFLASTMKGCNGDVPWPPTGKNSSQLHELNLQPDGETNAECADAGPDGDPAGTILRKIVVTKMFLTFTEDITDTLQNYVTANLTYPDQLGPNGTSEQGRPFPVSYFGWDWRRPEADSVAKLDQEITNVLTEGALQQAEGVDRVVLMAHSYGGYLMRAYAGAHPERVARILTLGTPYWGSPKVIFPLAFGKELPWWSGTDFVTDKTQMQTLARNLSGLYELFPSEAHFGPWLTVGATPEDDAGIKSEIASLGGQPALYDKAQTDHQSTIDGFNDGYGAVDYRVVAGGGLLTPGAVQITPTGNGKADVHVTMVNGDTTVALRSAIQGTDVNNPLGARVHIQVRCGVMHMKEPDDAMILNAYKDWLLFDRTPRKLDGNKCSDAGGVLGFRDKSGVKFFDSSGAAAPALKPDAAGTETTLEGAWMAGDIDLYDLDPQVLVTTSDYHPVTLGVDVTNEAFDYTPVGADGNPGTTLQYGPVTGHLVLVPGTNGAAPTVTVDGVTVNPTPAGSGGGGGGGTGGGAGTVVAPAPTGGAGETGGGGAGGGDSVVVPPPKSPPPSGVTQAPKVSLKGIVLQKRTLRVTLNASAAGKLRVALAKGKRWLLTLRGSARKAGMVTLIAKPSHKVLARLRPRLKLKATVKFTSSAGKATTIHTTVRLNVRGKLIPQARDPVDAQLRVEFTIASALEGLF
jgi:pimeloyl-ACP methyl ester carboxylesterase